MELVLSETDIKLFAVIIPAAVSIIAVTLTYIYKLLSELSDKRRTRKMFLISVRHELMLNHRISKSIEHETRTIGFRFVEGAWNSGDPSAIYRKGIPYDEILQIYSDVHMFNLLNERKSLIKAQPDYPGKVSRLAAEHAEMINLNDEIGKNLENVLRRFKPK